MLFAAGFSFAIKKLASICDTVLHSFVAGNLAGLEGRSRLENRKGKGYILSSVYDVMMETGLKKRGNLQSL